MNLFKENDYINWEIKDQERKRLIKLPEWASAERYEYVDSFVDWWFHRKIGGGGT